ncbi:MAG: VCBS repeat-containing protein [Verrucomicrobiales bacterium]|nr:VCBS repeat-containing protein [Verrucomicrobiales bacterium]
MAPIIQCFGRTIVRRFVGPGAGVWLMGWLILFPNFMEAMPFENMPPAIIGLGTGTWVVLPGVATTVDFQLSDPDGTPEALVLAVSVSPRDETAILDPADIVLGGTGGQRTFTVTTKSGVFGAVNVEVRATDPLGATSVARFQITSSWFRSVPRGRMLSGLMVDLDQDLRRDWFEGFTALARLQTVNTQLIAAPCGTSKLNGAGCVAADLNGDGWMDIVSMVDTASESAWSRVLLNTGNWGDPDAGAVECGLSTVVSDLPTGLETQVVAVDYDHDGDLDLMLGGAGKGITFPDTPAPVLLWQNDGSGTRFQPVPTPFPALAAPNFAWADYDNDGIQDVMLTGIATNRQPVSRLFRGDPQGGFQEVNQAFAGIWNGGAAWGDFDNDNDLDVVLVGSNRPGNGIVYQAGLYLYRNDQETFHEVPLPSNAAVIWATPRWIDMDGDGDLDLVIGGSKSSTFPLGETYLLRQESPGRFAFMGAVAKTGAAVVHADDWDGDGDVDLVAMSVDGVGSWLENQSNLTNPPPEPPSNLRLQVEDGTVVFSWDAARDANQSGGLSYNLRVGSAPGKDDLVVSMSDPTTGRRRLTAAGNVGLQRAWRWRRPSPGPVYWSVQAIDHGLAASAFAPEQRSEIGVLPPQIDGESWLGVTSTSAYLNADVTTFGQPTAAWMEWGSNREFGQTGSLQVIPASDHKQAWAGALFDLPSGTLLHARLVVSNQVGISRGTVFSFTTPAASSFGSLPWTLSTTGSAVMAWADFDEDGDMDLAVASGVARGVTMLGRGDGRGWFSEEILATNHPAAGSAQWTDADSDGDLDLLVAGVSASSPDRVFLNDNGRLIPVGLTARDLTGMVSPVWADFDQDGDPDPLMRRAALYRNLGRGRYGSMAPLAPSLSSDRTAWVNMGAPGQWDYVIIRDDAARVYRTRSPGLWETQPFVLPGVSETDSFTRDFTGDGLPDALLGLGGGRRPQLYGNDGGTNFVPLGSHFEGVAGGLIGHGDFDGDGHPDVVTAQSSNLLVWLRTTNSYAALDPVRLKFAPTNYGIAFVDFDNDGRLDFSATDRRVNNTNRLALYRNTLTSFRDVPVVPTNLVSEVISNRVILRWEMPTHAVAGVLPTFNVEIGTAPGGRDVVNGWADRDTGYRRVPRAGNAGYHREFMVRDLYPGTYFWTVQSVNEGYLGSPFASEGAFEIGPDAAPRLELSRGVAFRDIKVRTTGSGWLVMEHSSDLNRWTPFATNYLPAGREIEIELRTESATSMLLRGRLEAR